MGAFLFHLLSVCPGFFFFFLFLHRDLQIWSSVDDLQSLRPHFFCSIFTVNNQTLQLTFWPPVHLSWAFSFPFLCFSCSLSRVNENVALTDVVMCYTVYDHDLFLTQIIKGLHPPPFALHRTHMSTDIHVSTPSDTHVAPPAVLCLVGCTCCFLGLVSSSGFLLTACVHPVSTRWSRVFNHFIIYIKHYKTDRLNIRVASNTEESESCGQHGRWRGENSQCSVYMSPHEMWEPNTGGGRRRTLNVKGQELFCYMIWNVDELQPQQK